MVEMIVQAVCWVTIGGTFVAGVAALVQGFL